MQKVWLTTEKKQSLGMKEKLQDDTQKEAQSWNDTGEKAEHQNDIWDKAS